MTYKVGWTAGAILRGAVRRKIEQELDIHDVEYDIKEYRGILSSDYTISIPSNQSFAVAAYMWIISYLLWAGASYVGQE